MTRCTVRGRARYTAVCSPVFVSWEDGRSENIRRTSPTQKALRGSRSQATAVVVLCVQGAGVEVGRIAARFLTNSCCGFLSFKYIA